MQYIRVNIPFRNADKTIKLVERILKQNESLAPNSPIVNDLDFLAMADTLERIATLKNEIYQSDKQSKALYGKCFHLLGTAPGQNLQCHGTLKVLITKVRGFLFHTYTISPMQLKVWGFNVKVGQTKGRRTVKISITGYSTADLLELAAAIIARHIKEGIASPLIGKVDMAEFALKTTEANTIFNLAEKKSKEREAKNNEMQKLIGYAKGQTALIAGTCYNFITLVRNQLLNIYDQNPDELGNWGFDVVISQGTPGRKKKIQSIEY